jgi:hypothetical protein
MRSVLTVFCVAIVTNVALADERRFTYTYDPTVLPKGAVELEQWTTARIGKSSGDYVAWDLRTELEFGLTDNLQTALYLNSRSVRSKGVPQEDGTFSDTEEFEFKGISSEWVMKLTDPVADPIGIAAYLEVGLGPEEVEMEQKILLGKVLGPWAFALNLVAEEEWESEREDLAPDDPGEREIEKELALEVDAGVSYLLKSFAFGLEFRNINEYPDYGKLEHSTFFLGPVVHYRAESWWASLTVLPQIAAYRPTAHGLDLEEHERVEARLLVGIHF